MQVITKCMCFREENKTKISYRLWLLTSTEEFLKKYLSYSFLLINSLETGIIKISTPYSIIFVHFSCCRSWKSEEQLPRCIPEEKKVPHFQEKRYKDRIDSILIFPMCLDLKICYIKNTKVKLKCKY